MKADVIIIGAGPAGLSAAIELARKNISVIVVDEYYTPGGRLLGQYYIDPNMENDDQLWDGKIIAKKMASRAEELGVTILCNVSVWKIQKHWKLYISGHEEKVLEAAKLIIATGSAENSLAVKGWTLPGVYSIGAAQTFTNLHKIGLGEKVLIVGADPLAMSVFMEMKEAGIDVVSVVLPPKSPLIDKDLSSPLKNIERLTSMAHLAPNKVMRKMGNLFPKKFSKVAAHFFKYNILKIQGTPIQLRTTLTAIEGDSQVEYVYLKDTNIYGEPIGKTKKVEVDTVCLSAGLYPLADIMDSIEYEMLDIPELGGTVPIHGKDMTTNEKDLFVAGNVTGIEGAKVAIAQGKLCGISVLNSMDIQTDYTIDEAIQNVNNARETSPIKFIPMINQGRDKMQNLWEKYREVK